MRKTALMMVCGWMTACGVVPEAALNVVVDTDSVDLGTVVPPAVGIVLPSATVTVSNLGSGLRLTDQWGGTSSWRTSTFPCVLSRERL
jgi:hypothetical protein